MADKSKDTTTPAAQEPGRTGKKDGANPSPPAPISGRDDLKLISGIGPSVERKLRKARITTFAQIAAMTDDELKKMEAVIKVPGGVDWDAWKSEARAFMEPAVQGKKHDEPNPATVGTRPPAGADKGGAGDPPVSGSANPSDGVAAKQAVSETKSPSPGAKPTAESNASETAAKTPDVPQDGGGKGDGKGSASPSPDAAASDDSVEGDPYGAPGYLVVVKTAKKIKSRRRAGRSFSPEETLIPAQDLRKSEFEALEGDPALDIHMQDVETGEITKPPRDD